MQKLFINIISYLKSLAKNKITKSFLYFIFFLLILNLIDVILIFNLNLSPDSFLVKFTYVGYENNLPTSYQFLALLFSFFLLIKIAFFEKKNKNLYFINWFIISLFFLYLSFDELMQIHETIGSYIGLFFNASGYLYSEWVIVGIPFVLLFLAINFKFIKNLYPKTRNKLIFAGIIFCAGVLGFEMIGANYKYNYGYDLNYIILDLFEEFFEMIGIVLFIDALLEYLKIKKTESKIVL